MKHKRKPVNLLSPRKNPLNQRLVTGTLMLALGLPLAPPMADESQAVDALPDFSDSVNLTTADVDGDGFRQLASTPITPPAPLLQNGAKAKALKAKAKAPKAKDGSYRLNAQAVAGDGVEFGSPSHGSKTLIDQGGLHWYVNTAVTAVTSSNASAAVSEASFTHAVAASTSAGGTVLSTLSDAFDGYNSLCVSLTGATGPCYTGARLYDI
jgi:hypothetical protein